MAAGTMNAYGQPVGDPLGGWSPPPSPAREAIHGRTCRLEPLDVSRHADALFAAYTEAPDGRDWTYMSAERPGDLTAYRRFADAQQDSADPLHFAILAGGRPLGTAALMRIDPANGVIEVGHVLFAPRLQRTPAATEAIYLLMRRAFDLGYRRLEWKCDSLNAPSRRAAARYGFGFEGIFSQAIVTKGRNRDTAWYAMTDRGWAVAAHAIERWLDPENFDADACQRRTLADIRAALRDGGA